MAIDLAHLAIYSMGKCPFPFSSVVGETFGESLFLPFCIDETLVKDGIFSFLGG